MRNIIALLAIVCTVFTLPSCDFINMETIHGNGHIATETRNISSAEDIEAHSFFDVVIVHGSTPSVKIEADDNLIPYILTNNEGGKLVIRTRDHVGLKSDNKIKVYVTTDKVEGISLSGSGNVTGDDKLNGGDQLKLHISGSGNIKLSVNTPSVEAGISGSGSIELNGETKDTKITITGSGDYKAQDLQAENAEVHITGNGNVNVAASVKLNVHITGSGDVYYKGSPSIEQHITGSGSIKQM